MATPIGTLAVFLGLDSASFPPHGRSFFLELLEGQEYDWPKGIMPYNPERDPPQH